MNALKIALAAAAALLLASPAFADPPEGHGHGHGKHHEDRDDGDHDGDHHDNGRHRGEEKRFSREERDELSRYYHDRREDRDDEDEHHGLPPGWQKQIARGQKIPDDIWAHRQPVPQEVIVKLPVPPPPGVVLIKIHNQVVRAVEQTHEVLDVLGLPHPPAPPKITTH